MFKPLDPYAPDRNAERVKVLVDVAPANGLTICGQHFPHGVSEQIVYRDQLPRLKAKTQTQEDLAILGAAQRAYEGARGLWAKENPRKEDEVDDLFPGSVAGEFYRMTQRGIPPLKTLDVVEELPPPTTSESIATEQNKAQTNALLTIAKMAEQMQAMQAQLLAMQIKADKASK